MTAEPDSPEKPEKPEDSEYEPEGDTVDILGESTADDPVLLDGDVEDTTDDLLEIEDFPDQSPESEAVSESFPPPEPEPKRGSVLPMMFGGLVAGGIGFAAALALIPGLSGQSDDVSRMSELANSNSAAVADLSGQVDTLRAALSDLPPPTDISGLESNVAEISSSMVGLRQSIDDTSQQAESRVEDLGTQLAELRDRIAALEISDGNANTAQADEAAARLSAFQADLEALIAEAEDRIVSAEEKAQAILAEAAAAAEAKQMEAAEQAALAERQAMIAELKTAVDAGATFDGIVSALDDVPSELRDHADTGVPTMVALQQSFASAARSALATSQEVPEDASTGERFTAFLRRQTNARSLTPKDGNDPDAVLSRAEALLSQGKLQETLDEVSTLPEDAQNAMSTWLSDAQSRQAALQAVESLSDNLN